jgi:hypothetical protein
LNLNLNFEIFELEITFNRSADSLGRRDVGVEAWGWALVEGSLGDFVTAVSGRWARHNLISRLVEMKG